MKVNLENSIKLEGHTQNTSTPNLKWALSSMIKKKMPKEKQESDKKRNERVLGWRSKGQQEENNDSEKKKKTL